MCVIIKSRVRLVIMRLLFVTQYAFLIGTAACGAVADKRRPFLRMTPQADSPLVCSIKMSEGGCILEFVIVLVMTCPTRLVPLTDRTLFPNGVCPSNEARADKGSVAEMFGGARGSVPALTCPGEIKGTTASVFGEPVRGPPDGRVAWGRAACNQIRDIQIAIASSITHILQGPPESTQLIENTYMNGASGVRSSITSVDGCTVSLYENAPNNVPEDSLAGPIQSDVSRLNFKCADLSSADAVTNWPIREGCNKLSVTNFPGDVFCQVPLSDGTVAELSYHFPSPPNLANALHHVTGPLAKFEADNPHGRIRLSREKYVRIHAELESRVTAARAKIYDSLCGYLNDILLPEMLSELELDHRDTEQEIHPVVVEWH